MNKNVQILSIILVAPYWNLNASEQKIINCECKNISSSILEFKLSNKAGYDNNKLVNMVLKKYNKPIEQLTKQEYDYICNSLEEGKR